LSKNDIYSQESRKNKLNGFEYRKIYVSGLKLNLIKKNCLILIGVFKEKISAYYIKMYMLHMYIAFLNFIKEYYDKITNKLVKYIYYFKLMRNCNFKRKLIFIRDFNVYLGNQGSIEENFKK